MIVPVTHENAAQAAYIHSVSWKESHRSFCTPEFIELHSLEHQRKYIEKKMAEGSRFFMLTEDEPVAVVSVTGSLIEDLYVLPDEQGRGLGTELLKFAIRQCGDVPTLWILENNEGAERLYKRMGFKRTGRISVIADKLSEIEFSLEK